MKNAILLLVFILGFSASKSDDFWEPVNAPVDMPVSSIIRTADGDLLAVSLGVMKSTDNGLSWENIGKLNYMGEDYFLEDIPNIFRTIAQTANGYLFIGFGDGFVLRSKDGGDNWEIIDEEIQNISSIAIDENDALYVEDSYRLMKSTDYGDTWNEIPGIIDDNYSLREVKFDPEGNLYIGTTGRIYILEKGGTELQEFSEGILSDVEVFCFEFNEDYVFAGTDGYGFLRSSDKGHTWEKISSDLENIEISKLSKNIKGDLLACTRYNGAYISKDDGATWSVLDARFINFPVTDFLVEENKILMASYGLWESVDDGDSWAKAANSPGNSIVGYIDSDNNGTYYCITLSGYYIAESGFDSWAPIGHSPIPPRELDGMAVDNAGNLYLAGPSLFRSTDKGNTWTEDISFEDINEVLKTKDGNLYLVSNIIDFIVYRSTDNGESWEEVVNEGFGLGFGAGNNNELAVMAYDLENAEYNLKLSWDGGETWVTRLINDFDYIDEIIIDGDMICLHDYSIGFIRSMDKGETWTNIIDGFENPGEGAPNINNITLAGNSVWAATEWGVYRLDNDAFEWVPVNPMDRFSLQGKVTLLSDKHLYVSGYKGLFRSKDIITSVEELTDNNQLEAYPNPSSGKFSIKLDKNIITSDVKVRVTNISGRIVAERVYVASNNSIDLDISTLEQGIYYVNINAGTSSRSVMISVVK